MSPHAYALLGLVIIVSVLVAAMAFAVLRFLGAARDARRGGKNGSAESALLSAALQDAVAKLKAQERATADRAEASERLSSEIIASLTAGLLVVGLDGSVRIVNPAGRRMLQIPEDAPLDSYRALLDEPALSHVIDECLKTGTAIVRRTVNLPDRHQGASRLGVSVSPLHDGSGRPHGAVCLFTDLTAVQHLEEQLRLKESLATVGELTAGIAHEFRNGLATIHGYGRLLDPAALPEVYRPYVLGIRAEAESLSQIVTNFLNFARPAELTLSRVAMRAVCERAVDEVRAEVTALGGTIDIRGEFGAVDGDEVLLRQAFSNLLRNAVEACASASRDPRVLVNGRIDDQGRLYLTVEDNGPGVDAALRERIFRPFFTSKRTGTGLGLALVQKIVVFHNGRVAVTASPGGGARFEVWLPLAPSHAAVPAH